MKKISIDQKKEICGGMTTSMLWVALVGTSMMVSSITSLITTVVGCSTGNNQQQNSRTKSSGYIRAGMMPMRSAVSMPF